MVGTREIEAVERHYARLRGDGQAFIDGFETSFAEFIDPDIEWIEPFGTFQGADALRGMIRSHAGSGARYIAFIAEKVFATHSDQICVYGRSIGERVDGQAVDTHWVKIWVFRDGRGIRMTSFNQLEC